MLLMNLQKIKLQITKAAGKKGETSACLSLYPLIIGLIERPDSHAAGKKGGKGKKGKKGKGKGKGKGKKGKPLPGEKISELKNMDPENMLSVLVENKLINRFVSLPFIKHDWHLC